MVSQPGEGLKFEYYFDSSISVSVYNKGDASNFFADRMEINAGPAGVVGVPLKLTALDLRFSGITERIITAVALTKFGQEIRTSQGVLVTAIRDELALRTQPSPPAKPLPRPPSGPMPPDPVWNYTNPLGYFGDPSPENPWNYSGYWEEKNPLGHDGQWNLLVDLTGYNCDSGLRWKCVGPKGEQIFDERFGAVGPCDNRDVGTGMLTNGGDRSFSYSWKDVPFAGEGLYPVMLLFAANAAG